MKEGIKLPMMVITILIVGLAITLNETERRINDIKLFVQCIDEIIGNRI